MSNLSSMTCGQFISTASTPFFLQLNQPIDYFYIMNKSQIASGVAGSSQVVEAWGFPRYDAAGYANLRTKTVTTLAGAFSSTTSNGFTLINDAVDVTYPAIALATPFNSAANPTVWTTATAHGYVVGDMVRVYSLTGASQYGGLSMTVTAVPSSTTFTTLLQTSGVTAPTAGFVRKVGHSSFYYPKQRSIAAITTGTSTVITLLQQNDYKVGMKVTFEIPTAYGMNQLNAGSNGLPVVGTITAVDNTVTTNTITVDINSTGFTAFAWPAVGQYPQTFPIVTPYGEGNTNSFVVPTPLPYGNQDVLSGAIQNQARRGILIGTSVIGAGTLATGGTGDLFQWYATTADQAFPAI